MFISEILGTIHDGSVEVCATADAAYDPAAEKIMITLDAFTRRVSVANDGARLPQSWLPPGERVSEHLPRDETTAFVKDVFHNWTRRVRASIPHDLPLRS